MVRQAKQTLQFLGIGMEIRNVIAILDLLALTGALCVMMVMLCHNRSKAPTFWNFHLAHATRVT